MTVYNSQPTPSHDGFFGRQLASLESTPLDIIYLIADHAATKDLITLSKVSKPLRDLLSDPGVWRKLHVRTTSLLLPPGPYDWQSSSYLANVLLRAERLYSVWPSSSSCPQILQTRTVNFGINATLTVLLGRWLLVGEGSTLVCYDSQCCDFAKTLFDDRAGRRIIRVSSAGCVREDGVRAFVLLIFDESVIIAEILMDQGNPSGIQTILTCEPPSVPSWTDWIDVKLYHHLLVVTVGDCSSGLESSGRLVIMDIDTLRQYHLPPSTYDTTFDSAWVHTIAFFFATQTHLVKVIEFDNRYKVRFKVECFPLPTTHHDGTFESDVLYPSHQSNIVYGPKLRQCALIYESPINPDNGKASFTLCGLNTFPDGDELGIVEVFLEPDGSISFAAFAFARYLLASLCTGSRGQHTCGVTLRTNKQPLVFAIDYRGPGSFSFEYAVLDRKFPESNLIPTDAFGGTVFLSRRSNHQTTVEIVDFARDAQKAEGRLPERKLDGDLKMACDCGDCYLSSG